MELLGVFLLLSCLFWAVPIVLLWTAFLIFSYVFGKEPKQIRILNPIRIIGSIFIFGAFGLLLFLFINSLRSDDEIHPQDESPAVSSRQNSLTTVSFYRPYLSQALEKNDVNTVTVYLEAEGADPNIEIDDDTLLATAAAQGEEKIVRVILAYHPDLNAVGSKSHRTALAAAKGHKNIIKLLKAAGATR